MSAPRSSPNGPGSSVEGRSRQKERTRRDILEAARRLSEKGKRLGLDDVAVEAGVSRATVYRYFSSMDALTVELGLAAQLKSAEELFADLPPDPEQRMARLHEHFAELMKKNESAFRAYLRSTMEQWERTGSDSEVPLRGARRVALVESALEGMATRLSEEDHRRLVRSLSLLTFMEPFLVLKDVFGLEGEDAEEVLAWAIEKLMAGALAQGAR